MTSPARALAFLILLTAVGCHRIRDIPTYEGTEQRAVIGLSEIESSLAPDVFSLIKSQRPRWLTYRGPQSFRTETEVQVYLNGIHLGGDAQLRGLSLEGVREIEFLDSASATMRWGTNHSRGAIIIHTERRR